MEGRRELAREDILAGEKNRNALQSQRCCRSVMSGTGRGPKVSYYMAVENECFSVKVLIATLASCSVTHRSQGGLH